MTTENRVVNKRPRQWQPAFITTLRATGNVRLAAMDAGVSRKTAYKHKNKSTTFAEQWDEALEDSIDAMEAVARQRAMSGASDNLLMFMLKAHRPMYRDTYRPYVDGHEQRIRSVELKVTYDDPPPALQSPAYVANESDDDAD